MLKLYWARNTISIASAVALEEGGVHWESVRIDFARREQMAPEYAAINPKLRVPALATPGGVVTETGAILEYIGATLVHALVPIDPLAAARMREVMYYLASTMHVNHAHKGRAARWADQETSWADMAAKVPETMTASVAFIDDLIEGPLLFGDQITLADCWLFAIATWVEGDGVDLAPFEKMRGFIAAMEARPSVKIVRSKGVLD